uniref:Uncharacterized protein n=1 Tax=Chrysemys picta bellii TaxID=8478 RepID=A0A8C3H8G2_CHRPI
MLQWSHGRATVALTGSCRSCLIPLPFPHDNSVVLVHSPGACCIAPRSEGNRMGESFQAKRSPSSPQGAPKKRSAFGDITNAHKNQAGLRKKDAAKAGPRKAQKGTAALGVLKNNEINFKK